MALVFVVAVGLAWLAHAARTQRIAVETIRAAGGKVLYEDEVGSRSLPFNDPWPVVSAWKIALVRRLGRDYLLRVHSVDLAYSAGHYDPPNEETWRALASLRDVRELDISDRRINDSHMDYLRNLTELRYLRLARARGVTGTGLAQIRKLAHLRLLDLRKARIDDASMVYVGQLRELRELLLDGTPVGDRGVAELKGLHGLWYLSLANTQVGDAGLATLAGLSQLSLLDLAYTHVSDAGLVHLVPFQQLDFLDLSQTRVGGPGLVHLASLPRLRALYLSNSPVDIESIRQLKKPEPKRATPARR